VRLIGTVGTDVELRQLPSGATVAKGRLAGLEVGNRDHMVFLI
jgi:single-stranded DNA-binding protein